MCFVSGDLILRFLLPVVAAFAGAFAAFALENHRRKRQTLLSEKESANRTLFVLSRLVNDLGAFRQQYIDPLRDDPDRSLKIRAKMKAENPTLRIDVREMSFLVRDKQPELLMKILIQEDRYMAVNTIVDSRSEMHLREVQPRLEGAGLTFGQPMDRKAVEDALGPRILISMENMTVEMIELLDGTITSIRRTSEELWSHMKSRFPDDAFITIGAEIKSEV